MSTPQSSNRVDGVRSDACRPPKADVLRQMATLNGRSANHARQSQASHQGFLHRVRQPNCLNMRLDDLDCEFRAPAVRVEHVPGSSGARLAKMIAMTMRGGLLAPRFSEHSAHSVKIRSRLEYRSRNGIPPISIRRRTSSTTPASVRACHQSSPSPEASPRRDRTQQWYSWTQDLASPPPWCRATSGT